MHGLPSGEHTDDDSQRLKPGVCAVLHHADGTLDGIESLDSVVFGLCRDDESVGSGQGVPGRRVKVGRGIDQDEIEIVPDGLQCFREHRLICVGQAVGLGGVEPVGQFAIGHDRQAGEGQGGDDRSGFDRLARVDRREGCRWVESAGLGGSERAGGETALWVVVNDQHGAPRFCERAAEVVGQR